MTLDRYLLRQFFPVFCTVIGLFVLLICMADIMANLVRYLNYEVPMRQIMIITAYFLPKSISYAVPISLLFASAYTLGNLFSRNELTSVFAAGIPFRRFVLPLAAAGLFFSLFSFFFQDIVVIPALAEKNTLSRTALHQNTQENVNTDVVIKTENGKVVYAVDYFDGAANRLDGVSIVESDGEGKFVSLIRAREASWTGEYWQFSGVIAYREENGFIRAGFFDPGDRYRESPGTFRRNTVDVEALRVRDVWLLTRDLIQAGLPSSVALAEFWRRFSFSFVPFVVMLLSISTGGRFKKNIVLMSLTLSIGAAVVYYVMEMISMMLAQTGYIPAVAGAWIPVAVFSAAGFLLLWSAKT